MSHHHVPLDPPAPARVQAFKEVLNVMADIVGPETDDGQEFLMQASALCFASGCRCSMAEQFETKVLKCAQFLVDQKVRIVDCDGKPVDVLADMSQGIKGL